jgi:putative endonuclease
MNQAKNISLGKLGESEASEYLVNLGYKILARNWRIKNGEIDLIYQRPNGVIVFGEVKTRSSLRHGDPLEAISPSKLERIHYLAHRWLLQNERWGEPYEIDCIGILVNALGEISVDHRIAVS